MNIKLQTLNSYSDLAHTGVTFKNGPSEISTTWFDGFKTTDVYKAAAFGFVNSKVGHSTPVNSVTGLQFGFADGVSAKYPFTTVMFKIIIKQIL